ncbi:MAG: sulfite exporter TauE/SafE family protein [Candidatus Omnitrophota bacterium]
MFRICSSLFLTGVVLGSGPCLASCGPILISYIAGTKNSPLGGLRSWLIFSLSRVCVYLLLGAAAGFLGAELFNRYYWELPGYIIWILGGFFICFLGVLMFLGKHIAFRACSFLNKSFVQRDTKSLLVLGVIVGIFPCVPLMGVYSYITMVSHNPGHGIIMSAAFGLGTVISPMIFLGMLAGTIPRLKMLKDEKNLILFRRICGVVLFSLGVHILVKITAAYMKSLS